ncbi:MAG: phosphoribosylaminoimidazolesuccinocarboxamide synthase [Candidatus Omnitrophica bacterium]|nr:phosphoribosylaminoimidazolesuccinocarboxamide synthase [Candidatus Omnitrophota bacterium]
MGKEVLLQTDFKDLKLFRRGKVRDVYDLGDKLLIVSTDRISCFDVVLPCGIPDKGKVLTSISEFWFGFIKELVPHHLITLNVDEYPPELNKYKTDLIGRSMLVLKTKPLPVECVVRGYISGSGLNEYKKTQSICGINLPKGLQQSDKLPEPIFTPSTKADVGHDQNVDQKYISDLVGSDIAEKLKKISIEVYKRASSYALEKGIIIADTKFEFGIYNNQIMIIDEVLTPDSSRFWPLEGYKSGVNPMSFDKQFVRDYLETLDWNKTPPAPGLPKEIIAKTTEKYLEAYYKLTGKQLR